MQDMIQRASRRQAGNLAVLGTVFVLAMILGFSVFGRASSAYTEVGTNQIQDSLLTPIVDPINPTYILVNEEALNLGGNQLPSQLSFSLSESYNGGTPQNIASCNAVLDGGALALCLFHAHILGWGHYVFIGSISSNGKVLAQTAIDPYIEPEW